MARTVTISPNVRPERCLGNKPSYSSLPWPWPYSACQSGTGLKRLNERVRCEHQSKNPHVNLGNRDCRNCLNDVENSKLASSVLAPGASMLLATIPCMQALTLVRDSCSLSLSRSPYHRQFRNANRHAVGDQKELVLGLGREHLDEDRNARVMSSHGESAHDVTGILGSLVLHALRRRAR